MDLTSKAPGWEKYEPVEGVELEIKRLNFDESLDLNAKLETKEEINEKDETEIIIVLPPPAAKECFKKYVRNIEGLKINGKKIKVPEKLLRPEIAGFPELQVLYGMCIKRFFAMNIMQEDETKN